MLFQADAALIPFADKTFHTCVTSPPYWGLRKYQGAQGRVWGGDKDCVHEFVDRKYYTMRGASGKSSEAFSEAGQSNADRLKAARWMTDSTCKKCGAWYGSLGLEPTPQLHIQHIVEIFREVKRVLRDDGVCFLNYGDCFQGENIRADNVAPLSEIDASWLAALIDSDGSITIARNKRSNKKTVSYHALVSVTQTKKQMVNRAHDLCGGATSSEKRPERERTFFRWYLAGQQAAPILRAIYPYLMLKQAQAAIAIMLCEHVAEKKFHRSNPITQEAKEYRGALKESVRRLNALKSTIIEPKRPRLYKQGMAQGNLLLMPHRVAIALQEDGWVVRNDLVWRKSNPMPESCAGWRFERKREKISKSNHATEHNIKGGRKKMLEDASVHQSISPEWLAEYEYGEDYELRKGSWRHTRAHEYVFQLVKSRKGGMKYWCNQEAVREIGTSGPSDLRKMEEKLDRIGGKTLTADDPLYKANKETHIGKKRSVGSAARNPRSVLDVPTAPYKGAHYATFPPNLIAPLIRASCPRRACPECGQGWSPVVEKGEPKPHPDVWSSKSPHQFDAENNEYIESQTLKSVREHTVRDYRPTCDCTVCTVCCFKECQCGRNSNRQVPRPIPGIVLDPFIGSGTTGAVAKELQRRWVGLDISMEYLDEQAKIRALNWTPSHALDDLPLFNL